MRAYIYGKSESKNKKSWNKENEIIWKKERVAALRVQLTILRVGRLGRALLLDDLNGLGGQLSGWDGRLVVGRVVEAWSRVAALYDLNTAAASVKHLDFLLEAGQVRGRADLSNSRRRLTLTRLSLSSARVRLTRWYRHDLRRCLVRDLLAYSSYWATCASGIRY